MSTDNAKMADEHQVHLLRRAPANAGPAPRGEGAGFSWLPVLGFAFLTFNSAMAIYRSDGDLAAIGFVAFSYVDLVLLFICLRCYEKEAPGSATRGKLKVAVWILTTLLTMVFSYKVAAIMPLAVKVVVWAMACATVMGGFYAFFVYTEKSSESENRACRSPPSVRTRHAQMPKSGHTGCSAGEQPFTHWAQLQGHTVAPAQAVGLRAHRHLAGSLARRR